MKSTKIFLMIVGLFVVIVAIGLILDNGEETINKIDYGSDEKLEMKKFSSEEELLSFIEESQESQDSYGINLMRGGAEVATMTMDAAVSESGDSSSKGVASDYSSTNVQVEGIDEADILKNDGRYIYLLSEQTLYIIDAYPADSMKVVSKIELDGWVNQFFLNGDKLIIFDQTSEEVEASQKLAAPMMDSMIARPYYNPQKQFVDVLVYDIENREDPKLENSVEIEGNYVNSRMIGENIYIVSNKYINPNIIDLPIYRINGVEDSISFDEVYRPIYPGEGYQFTSVSALNIEDLEFETETYLIGNSYTMYMSENNIYLTQAKRIDYEEYYDLLIDEVYEEILPAELMEKIEEVTDAEEYGYYKREQDISKIMAEYMESVEAEELTEFTKELEELMEEFYIKSQKLQRTAIYKIEVEGNSIDLIESGSVPGRLLNQFSMDEMDENLRVVTTTGNMWGRGSSLNHLFILNEDMKIIGSVEDLAEGERIYSSRFMGDKAYMVTYRNVDPLFVIDTSDAKNPEVLGYLKVSGYSDYLHPYSEDILIGIGKETEIVDKDRALVQGVKISLFDVSDFENPKEIDKIEIGSRGTNSQALHDHKAVLFDKEKNLLVLPMTVYEEREDSQNSWDYGEIDFVGAYVFDIDESGIKVKGRISHKEDRGEEYYNSWLDQVNRALYMDDTLYTLGSYKIIANDLGSLSKIKKLDYHENTNYKNYIDIEPMILE